MIITPKCSLQQRLDALPTQEVHDERLTETVLTLLPCGVDTILILTYLYVPGAAGALGADEEWCVPGDALYIV